MPTLFANDARKALNQRLARLRPDAPPRWGRFTAPRMLAHVNDGLRMALGDLPTVPKKLPLRYPPLKQLLIYVLPFPKGAPTARELLARVDQAEWDVEVAAFPALIERTGASGGRRDWPLHPAFGRLSSRAWGVLGYRHVDHHFTQFGV